jgi:hypothetical protein
MILDNEGKIVLLRLNDLKISSNLAEQIIFLALSVTFKNVEAYDGII